MSNPQNRLPCANRNSTSHLRGFFRGILIWGQVIRFDLELAVKPGQDPKKPIGVVNNDLRQRFALMLAKWNGSLYHSNLYHT
jgi:hypothetical protein